MPELPSPWREFLTDLDNLVAEPVALHGLGGFVVRFFYGLASRITGDIDYYTAIPNVANLQDLAGPTSLLAHKHKVYLQRVTVTELPEDYESRLTEMFPNRFRNLRFYAPDPYDLMLSKLERNSGKDREDAVFLFQELKLDPDLLEQRYQQELRPNLSNPAREDLTLMLWLEMFRADAGN
jgi:hypothetical protein